MDLQATARSIAQHYFRPPPGKPVVVACDSEKVGLARALAAELEKQGHPAVLAMLEGNLPASQQALQRLLENDAIALAVFASHAMWSGLGLSQYLTFRSRQPSLLGKPDPLFFDAVIPLDSLERLYCANPASIRLFVEGLRRNLPDHRPVRLTTQAGTRLTFTARIWEPWGWELMTCPLEDSIDGKIVVDGGVFFDRITQPIELTIRHGKLAGMACQDPGDAVFRRYRQWMMEAFETNPANAQLCEVGLGVNPGAQLSPVVMESEAVQGTAHFCFGDNAQFAGMGGQNQTGWHGGTVILTTPRLKLV